MQRSIEAPERTWNDVRQAAAWLGLPLARFRAEARARPDLLPAQQLGKAYYWHWLDLVLYDRWRSRQPPAKFTAEKS